MGRMGDDAMEDRSQTRGIHHSSRPSRSAWHHRYELWCALLCLVLNGVVPPHVLAVAWEQLPDLTDKAALAVVTLKGRDNFNSEYVYDVSVKNLSAHPLVGESLILVLDKITNIGGSEWMTGTSDSNLARMGILGQDGETEDGKPYFRIPRGSGPDLPAYTQSDPATVRIRNKDYLVVFTPIFRVYGMQRLPCLLKPNEQVTSLPPVNPQADGLIQLLIQKGVLSEQEECELYQQ